MNYASLARRLEAIESRISNPGESVVLNGCKVEPEMSWKELLRHIAANGRRLVLQGI